MFPDDWDDYHEWCRPPEKRTWRNAFIRAGSGALCVLGVLWAVLVGLSYPIRGLVGPLLSVVGEALHRADEWLNSFTEYEEDLEAYRERIGDSRDRALAPDAAVRPGIAKTLKHDLFVQRGRGPMATNDDWLALTVEEILEPALPICDPHHHLWDLRPGRVEPRYLLDEFLADLNSGHNVVSTVFIECGAMFKTEGPEALRPVGETEFVNEIATLSASGARGPTRVAAGIVGTADLRLGDAVAEVLDAHIAAGGGRFRGIRVGATWHASPEVPNHRTDPPEGLYADRAFREGFAQLAPRHLSFEGWCYHTQIPELTDLARAFPDTTIVLDHFGGPIGVGPYAGKRDEVFAAWRRAVEGLAACPNVVAKLGGIAMEVNGFGWHERPRPPTSQELVDATRPYYEQTIELFGVDRCMFESNFPVEKVSCSYRVLWNAFKRLTAGWSADEKNKLFHDTAARVYRLGAGDS